MGRSYRFQDFIKVLKYLKFRELRGSVSGLNKFFVKNVRCLNETQKTMIIPLNIKKGEELTGLYFKALISAMGLSDDEFDAALKRSFTQKDYLSKLRQLPQSEIECAHFAERLT